jgi:hypothetical protein
VRVREPTPAAVSRPVRRVAPVPLPDPAPPAPARLVPSSPAPATDTTADDAPLRVAGLGLALPALEEAVRATGLPVEVADTLDSADAVLSLRGHLGRDPALRRRAQALGLPILVIKSEAPHQLERALQRLLGRRRGRLEEATRPDPQLEDVHAAMEECRLAVEQVVLPQGRPVELLPRSERVRQMQAELVGRYRLRSAVFGRGLQQRLRVFPA